MPAAMTGEQPADVPQLKALLAPHPSDEMICWPVSARVGNVKNTDPSRVEPIAASRNFVQELTTTFQAGNGFRRMGVGI